VDLQPFSLDVAAAGFDAARLERITAHLERYYIAPGKIAGCQVAVARHGHLAYQRSFGHLDREREITMPDDAIFRIYSMTKPITSVALMTLFEQGRFRLDDPVARFFPEWRDQQVWVSGSLDSLVTEPARRPVSMRDVLSHTGGLTYGAVLPGVGKQHEVDDHYEQLSVRSAGTTDSMDDFMGKLARVPLRFQPGTAWMYSLSTDVCGALVEKVSGMPFAEYLRTTIFEPLGMVDTAFGVTSDRVGRFAANYGRTASKKTVLIDDPTTSAFTSPPAFCSGGGGLTGTTADYLRFCEMLRRGGELDGHRVIGSRTLDLMTRNHLPGGRDLATVAIDSFSETANDGIGFGLGFAMTTDQVAAGGLSRGDYYWGGAASTIFWVDPVEDLSVVFMTQLMPSGSFDFRGQLKSLIYSAFAD
jgi:CubicO group peptidase (beta-lactamase class C family)